MNIFKSIGRRQIIAYVLAGAILTVSLLTAARGAATTYTASGSQRLLPIYSVGRGEDDKIISISFDAAWGNEDTEQLIEILDKYSIKTTFFVVGDWVEKYPESVKALHDAGHEIMNHSDTHPHMTKLSREQMRQEIETCNDKIEAITGVRPTLLRAPYGEYNNTLIEVLDELGMYCIQWDVDSLDWKNPTSAQIAERVCSNVRSGSIVLFHNAADNTPAALPILLENLQGQGYSIVPVSQNIYCENFTLDHEGRQQRTQSVQSGTASK